MGMFVDKWPDMMAYEATEPVEDVRIKCACGHEAYEEDAVEYDGEWYCSDKCKAKAILNEAETEDYKAFALTEWLSFVSYIASNEDEFIRDNLNSVKPAKEMWADIFKEYAGDCIYEFADWYEHREVRPYRRSA